MSTPSRSFWIQVVGSKKSGKTSLLEDLTLELTRRGRSVCFVKHSHEPAVLDGTDTDTERLRRAGARTAVLVGETSTVVFRAGQSEPLERIAQRHAEVGDVVLAEGFKAAPGRKIAIAGGDLDVAQLEGLIAVVGDAPGGYDGRVFRPNQVTELCDAIEEELAEDSECWATSLMVDGNEVPLNAFVQEIMASGLMGMAAALEGVEGGTTLEMRCRRVGKRPAGDG